MDDDVDGPSTEFDYCMVNDAGALSVDLDFWISKPLTGAPTFALEQTGAAASLSRKWTVLGKAAGQSWHLEEKVDVGAQSLKVDVFQPGSDSSGKPLESITLTLQALNGQDPIPLVIRKKAQTWADILPTRSAKPVKPEKLYAKLLQPTGKPPEIQYLQDANDYQDTWASGSPSTPDAIAQAVDAVKKARARIPPRPFHLDFTQNKGNLYMPSGQYRAPSKAKGWAGGLDGIDSTPEFATYKSLSSGVVATGCDPGQQPFDPVQKTLWDYFQELWPAEGLPTTITAGAVDSFVTFGAGLASSGHKAQQALKVILDNAASKAGPRALAAGLRVDMPSANMHEFTVVDVDHQCVLTGKDAANYLCASIPLLSLIADISLGALGDLSVDPPGGGVALETDADISKAQIRATLDGHFAAFKSVSGSDVGTWPSPPVPYRVLVLHARHAGDFGGWDGGGATTVDGVATNVWNSLKTRQGTSPGPLTVVRKARAVCDHWAAATIKAFAADQLDGYSYATNGPAKDATVTWKAGKEP